MSYKLYLGNQVYSSWSLRAWMLFKAFNIPLNYEIVPLYTKEFENYRKNNYPVKSVPALEVEMEDNKIVIWDSFAIVEFLYESYPDLGIWPANPSERAIARSLCAEMHSGFTSLRTKMPMNLKRYYRNFQPDNATQVDIDRIQELWSWAKQKWGKQGTYLFGRDFSAVDAFFVPVAERFRTYNVELNKVSTEYSLALLNNNAAMEFNQAAQNEKWIMPHNEFEDR